jgi:LacI family transcriptional regulator
MKKNKVLIALKMSGIAGQLKLAGIFRYLNEKYNNQSPWNIHLLRSRNDLTQETVRDAVENRTDGFIISIPNMENSVLPLSEISTPTIIMDIHSKAMEKREKNIVFIRNSAEDIGREAARFFMGQGVARSYAFLHSNPVTDWSKNRFIAFKRALNDAGLWCEELFEPSDITKLKRPLAVFAANDDRAFELMKTLAAKRIKSPHNVAVLGVDNDALICENARPRISSVEPDFEKEGYLAAQTLDSMMNGNTPSSRTILIGVKKIVRRESTTEESTAGKLVQKAIAYIDLHALEGIEVSDVVRHLKCSRRLADLRFRELQKRSILDAITERRLDEVKRLLAGSKEKIDTIASACGYANPNYLKNLFKKRFGMSMREFRKSANPNNPYVSKR